MPNDLYQAMLDAEQAERNADSIAAVRRAIFYAAADYFVDHEFTPEKYAALGVAADAWHAAREIADAHHAATLAARTAWLRTVKTGG